MPDIIHHYHAPWGARASAELLLADDIHPPRNDIRPVLGKVGGQQDCRYQGDMPVATIPARETHDTRRPDDAMDQTPGRGFLLVQGEPVVLEQVIANEMTDDSEE